MRGEFFRISTAAVSAPVVRLDQLQRDDAAQDERELRADLLVLIGREGVDDAVDRLRRVVRVQRGEDEVAGLGGGEHGLHRLHVAHLADHDHVGVLAHGVAQRFLEVRRVGADLALRDGGDACR